MNEHNCELNSDNQGFCWSCGKPVNIEYYACYVNPYKYQQLLASDKFNAEWQTQIDEWERNHV